MKPRSAGHLHVGLSVGGDVIYCRSITFLLVFASFWTPAGDAASVTMNKCKHPDGRIEFTDRPCPADALSSSIENKTSSNGSSRSSEYNSDMVPLHIGKQPKNRIYSAPTQPQSQQVRPEAKSEIASSGLPAEDRLKSCDPSVAIAAAEETVSNPANLKEPMQLFSPAFTFFQNGKKDEGVFWFYAAQLRVRQQMILENGNRGQLLAVMQMTMGGPINNYAFQNTSNLNQILDRVLEWDKKTTNPFIDKARSQKLDKEIDLVYVGFSKLKSKLVNERTSLEAAAQQAAPGIQQMLAQMNSQRCRKGQPDPAYENQTRKEEERLALEYITHNDQVIKLAGGTVKTFPASSTIYSNDRNKGRYDFSITGHRTFYAIVDVNRSSGKPVFSLACVTTLSMGYREAGKDACTQSTILLPK
jgi:hypothetical protein